ncbi:hypothetical protein [Runella slithyformis]|uniref:Uncharacterized protein n=1 Tax=Runella slithyformis (strain ATCC 29530 / DSM 19594 / LMG 11500 / NCIMB 11436 / LSU 4) TaxID=761193 RepID=A0A7U4E405_RUNSL|nr:hypothetical protein [Runella slithyformis]AEI46991.1 hypothetical protein Runsl_0548 [Runella slithyformis DSM 19594]
MKKEKETKKTQDNHLSPQSQQNQGAKKEDSAPATGTQTDNHQNGVPNRGPQQRSQNKSK